MKIVDRIAGLFRRPPSVADEQRRRRLATAERVQRETYTPLGFYRS